MGGFFVNPGRGVIVLSLQNDTSAGEILFEINNLQNNGFSTKSSLHNSLIQKDFLADIASISTESTITVTVCGTRLASRGQR
ncbi:hypothetical protein LMG23992_04014 [Cupriavidus laharis]|uniref:Uncharacterized protein n=1 Tax=Cupriavidus laharis TaxID=151654 RepID=A0ABN7Z5M5_9BURK|nr:hypothetical protein [Cupriavidus laharis]CAG9179602.1 hypothetical protein LMG23992_04014 [Cupriavidus laharis]